MKSLWMFCGVVVVLANCTSPPSSQEKQQQDARGTQIHAEMSFENLAQVGHYLTKALEHVENRCAIPQNKLSGAPKIYQSFVDERYSEVQEDYLKKSLAEKVKFWNPECVSTCSCDVYVGFSEYLQSFNFYLSITELKAVEKLKSLEEQEKAKTPACMQQASWVCESRILKDILRRTN